MLVERREHLGLGGCRRLDSRHKVDLGHFVRKKARRRTGIANLSEAGSSRYIYKPGSVVAICNRRSEEADSALESPIKFVQGLPETTPRQTTTRLG
ncbi:hypothetical protein M407DRAFT_245707 [Tulasnella calospora MUT 4182]|uniref:Uncharacterized protein n=1 Tax=Tulasnella calospora MUT 4182 TaxID=1051891 RepID=A0A0C3Q9N3_9AGAM|nr:hypothetical protein M407DRAFT_245707 [Tulasnella calospora MUT 4182]